MVVGVGGAALLALAAPTGHAAPPGGREPGEPPLAWPVSRFLISQPFGCTSLELEPADPECPGGHFHAGLDLAAPSGTGVRATADGVVLLARADTAGYGLHVLLDHGGGLTSLYGHLDTLAVRRGEPVLAGQAVGTVGSTGNSTGPHLHFEVRRGGGAIDPAGRLPAHHDPLGGIQ